MKHLGLAVLAVTVAAAITVACFSDPTSSLRNGPSSIELSRTAVTLKLGDSVSIQALVKDEQGNIYDAGSMQWSSDAPNVAIPSIDSSKAIPFNEYSKVFLVSKADTNGGVAHIIATYNNIVDTCRVLILPTRLSSTAQVTGTARADTIAGTAISAGDTLVVTSTAAVRFDTTRSGIVLGTKAAYVFSRTPTVLKAVALAPYSGQPRLTNLLYGGPAEVGMVSLDSSMYSNSVVISRPRYYATITVTGDTMFVPAPTGTTFDATTGNVRFGTVTPTVFSRTSSLLKVIYTANKYSGLVTVRNVILGATTLDSLVSVVKSDTLPKFTAQYTGTVTQTGDTLFLAPATGTTFDTLTSAVTIGTNAAAVMARSATQIKALAYLAAPAGTDSLKVSNVHLGLATVGLAKGSMTYTVNKALFTGAVTQLGDTLTVAPPTGFTFDTTTATVKFGTSTGILLRRTATSLKVLSPIAYSGPITVVGVKLGLATVTLATSASYTLNAATFIATVAAGGNLLDTVKIKAGTGFQFSATGTNVSDVMINGRAAFVLRRTTDSMYVVSKVPNTGQIGVTYANVGGTIIAPALLIPGNVAISGTTTGEANEPGNDVRATATTLAFTGANDTITVYGSIDCEDDGTACPGNGDILDYYQFQFGGGTKIKAILTWFGNGTGGSAYNDTNNPDLDMMLRDAAANTYGTNTSSNGAGQAMPEVMVTTSSLAAATTYYIRVMAWLTPSPITYQLKIMRVP